MKNLMAALAVLVCFGCSNADDVPVQFSYRGDTFSFQLEEFGKDFKNVSGNASGSGFKQASGELDDVFSHLFEEVQFEMDPRWEGRYFKLSVNFHENRADQNLLQKMIKEIQDGMDIKLSTKTNLIKAKCLEEVDGGALQRHLPETDQAVGKGSRVSQGKLQATGHTLGDLVNLLNKLGHSNRYHYDGRNNDVYQFDLDVSDEGRLSSSLLPYGLALSDCEKETSLIIID